MNVQDVFADLKPRKSKFDPSNVFADLIPKEVNKEKPKINLYHNVTGEVFDPEGSEYDYESAISAGLKPDETDHWPSRNPKTGRLLKGKKHETWDLLEKGEEEAGYRIYKGEDGKYYSYQDPQKFFDTKLKPQEEQLVKSSEWINKESGYLKNTEPKSQEEVDAYNKRVKTFNKNLEDFNTNYDAYKVYVDDYKKLKTDTDKRVKDLETKGSVIGAILKNIANTAINMKDTSTFGLEALGQIVLPAITPQKKYKKAISLGFDKAEQTIKDLETRTKSVNDKLINTPKAKQIAKAIEFTMKPFELAASGLAGITELTTQLIKKQGIDKAFTEATKVINGESPGETILTPIGHTIGSAAAFFGIPKLAGKTIKAPIKALKTAEIIEKTFKKNIEPEVMREELIKRGVNSDIADSIALQMQERPVTAIATEFVKAKVDRPIVKKVKEKLGYSPSEPVEIGPRFGKKIEFEVAENKIKQIGKKPVTKDVPKKSTTGKDIKEQTKNLPAEKSGDSGKRTTPMSVKVDKVFSDLVPKKKVKTPLDQDQQNYIDARIVGLGSLEAVKKEYKNVDDVSIYAREKAAEVYYGDPEVTDLKQKLNDIKQKKVKSTGKYDTIGSGFDTQKGKVVPFKEKWQAKKKMKLAAQKAGADVSEYDVREESGGWVFQRREIEIPKSKWNPKKEFETSEDKENVISFEKKENRQKKLDPIDDYISKEEFKNQDLDFVKSEMRKAVDDIMKGSKKKQIETLQKLKKFYKRKEDAGFLKKLDEKILKLEGEGKNVKLKSAEEKVKVLVDKGFEVYGKAKSSGEKTQPFKLKHFAEKNAAERGDGFEVKPVKDGYVVVKSERSKIDAVAGKNEKNYNYIDGDIDLNGELITKKKQKLKPSVPPSKKGKLKKQPAIKDKEKEVAKITKEKPFKKKSFPEKEYDKATAEIYAKQAKKAYTSGDLEAPEYMFIMDLLTKKDLNSVKQILEKLNPTNSPNLADTVIKGKGGADLKRLISMLGSQMYKGNLAEVTIKEITQNSFDAVKASVNQGKVKDGKITILTDPESRIIAIKDNGQGMSKDVILNAFLTVAGTSKEGLNKGQASGGFGMAKAAFLYGNEWISVNTVKNGKRYKFKASGDELLSKEIDITESKAPKEEHGTTITIKVPEFVDIEGEQKYVWFPEIVKEIAFFRKPLLHDNVEVLSVVPKTSLKEEDIFKLNNPDSEFWNQGTLSTIPVGKHFDISKYEKNTTAKFDWGTAEIFIGKDRKTSNWDINHNVLSSGIYQFNDSFEIKNFEKVPFDVIINVHPTVDASSPAYPFNVKREGWKDTIAKDISALKSYVKNVALGIEAQETVNQFKNIKSLQLIDVGDIGTSNIDITEFITPKKKNKTLQSTYTPKTVTIKEGKVTGKNEKGEEKIFAVSKDQEKIKSSFDAGKAVPSAKDFLIETGVDDSKPIFHNNTNVDYFELARQHGLSAEEFFAELGSAMIKIKEAVSDTNYFGYDVLSDKDQSFFFGISIDKGYHGVNTVIPFKAALLNPLAIKQTTLPGLTYGYYDTIIHEFAHIPQRNHDASFVSEMARLHSTLASTGTDLELRVMLGRVLKKHQKLINVLRGEFEKSTTKNLAKSLDKTEGGGGVAAGRIENGSKESVDTRDGKRVETSGGRKEQTGNSRISNGSENSKKFIKPILNEKGFVDLTALKELGEKFYTGGKQKYFDWQKKMKAAIGDAWEKVKKFVGKIWKELKTPVSNERGSVTIKPLKKVKKNLAKAKKTVDEYLAPISTRLGNISEKLKNKLIEFELDSNTRIENIIKDVIPYIKKVKQMSKQDREAFHMARLNSDTKVINELTKKYGMEEDHIKLRVMLDTLRKAAESMGYKSNYIKEYHPREVADFDGLQDHLRKSGEWSTVDLFIKRKEKKRGKKLSHEERVKLVNSLFRGYADERITLSKPGQLKLRRLQKIDKETAEYFADSDSALLRYVTDVVTAIEAKKIFGAHKNKSLDLDDTIGAYILDLVENGDINAAQERELRSILKARFSPLGTSGIVTGLKNLTLIDVMGNFGSAVVQIGDVAWSLYNSGIWSTMKVAPNAILGKSKFTKEDLGISKIGAEFSDKSTTAKFVDTVFNATGLTKIDAIGKELLINSAYDIAIRKSKLAETKRGRKEFLKELEGIFGEDAERVLDDFKNKRTTRNVKLYLLHKLSDFQPATLTELPEKYLVGGNWRILYMLKSFAIKRLDVYRREIFQNLKRPGARLKGLKNLIRLAVFLTAMEASADVIKNLLYNKEFKLDNLVISNMMDLIISSYTRGNVSRKGLGSGIAGQIVPPMQFVDSAWKDLTHIGDDKGLESVKSIPLVGKLYYSWFGKGSEKKKNGNYLRRATRAKYQKRQTR